MEHVRTDRLGRTYAQLSAQSRSPELLASTMGISVESAARIIAERCDHGRDAETCDDCNEQRGADMAEASVGR